MEKIATLDWSDVSQAAEGIFRIWQTQSSKELDWANTAWIALGRAGLTKYSDEIEKTLVLVRFIALGTMFREFCELARDESFDTGLSDWLDLLEISPVRVGQVLGPGYRRDCEDFLDIDTALLDLIDEKRPGIFEALVKAFGNESSLFSSLWRATDGAEIEEPEEADYFILNDATASKMEAFEWITSGMPRLH
jgi:hypothetical protein